MINPPLSEARVSRASIEPVIVFAIFVFLVACLGGASRADVFAQAIVRAVAVLAAAYSLVRMPQGALRRISAPLGVALGWIALIAIQLVPLPPNVWTGLPGREPFAALAGLAGFEQPWRPLSVSPDATWNALLAMTVPLAALLVLARVAREHLVWIGATILALCLLSAFVALLQMSSGGSSFYLYRVTNEGAAVGLMANRNHQALLLCVALPLLATVALDPRLNPARRQTRLMIAMVMAMFIVPLTLVTGSRAGLLLMLIGAAGAALLMATGPGERRDLRRQPGKRRTLLGFWRGWPIQHWAALGGTVIVVLVTVFLSRAEAVQRLFSQDVSQETRVSMFGPMVDIAWRYAPWGAGFGTFDPVFRIHEPFGNLSFLYLNHAHNDALEILIEGGAPAALLALTLLGWIVSRSISAWRRPGRSIRQGQFVARCASLVAAMIVLSSLGDYPLRTPIVAMVFVVALVLLAGDADRESALA